MELFKSRFSLCENRSDGTKCAILTLPRDIFLYELSKYLVDIDSQILRKTSTFFSGLFPYKSIEFNDKDLITEFVHVKRYQKFWTIRTMNKIARKGDLESLKYLRENGCIWGVWTTAYAARGGHLECLKYAHENGCSWNWRTTAFVARGEHVQCIIYAIKQGCEWNTKTTDYAAGHLNCLKYVYKNYTEIS